MSSNPFNLDRAVDALRTETPSTESRERTRKALLTPTRKSFRTPILVTGLTAVAAVAVLWPRAISTTAWAQVAANTGGQIRTHVIMRMSDGSGLFSERWTDGDRYSMNLYLPSSNKSVYYARCDGKTAISYMPNGRSRNGTVRPAKRSAVHPTGYRFQDTIPMLGGTSSVIDDLIKEGKWKVEEQTAEVATPEGKRDRYRIVQRFSKSYAIRAVVYVDPETKLIRKVDALDKRGIPATTTICDYPSAIPDETFAPVPPPGVPVVDMEEENAQMSAILKKGLGSQTVAGKTIVLRAVLHDFGGSLWVLWTGGAPSGDLRNPVVVDGYKGAKAFGLKAFTTGWKQAPHSYPAPAINDRLGGMGLSMQNKSLDRITLTVPVLDSTGKKKLGSAKFVNIPVRKIDSIYDYSLTLGLHRRN